MRALRHLAIILLVLALLPWGAHLGAAAGQVSREPATATAAAAPAARPILRPGTCRTALPIGPCHLDHVATTAETGAGTVPQLRLRPHHGAFAPGRSEPPGHPPPRSF